MVEMTNKGIAPDSIVIDGIVDGFVRTGDVGEAISFAQHAFNQVCQSVTYFLLDRTQCSFELPRGSWIFLPSTEISRKRTTPVTDQNNNQR